MGQNETKATKQPMGWHLHSTGEAGWLWGYAWLQCGKLAEVFRLSPRLTVCLSSAPGEVHQPSAKPVWTLEDSQCGAVSCAQSPWQRGPDQDSIHQKAGHNKY